MESPEDMKHIHDQERDRMSSKIAEQLEVDGWERCRTDRWRKSLGETDVNIHKDDKQAWVVTVETNGEVMRLPFSGATFGAAVAHANRIYNLTKENQDIDIEDREKEDRDERDRYETDSQRP